MVLSTKKLKSDRNILKVKGSEGRYIRTLLALGYKLDDKGNVIQNPEGNPIDNKGNNSDE